MKEKVTFKISKEHLTDLWIMGIKFDFFKFIFFDVDYKLENKSLSIRDGLKEIYSKELDFSFYIKSVLVDPEWEKECPQKSEKLTMNEMEIIGDVPIIKFDNYYYIKSTNGFMRVDGSKNLEKMIEIHKELDSLF